MRRRILRLAAACVLAAATMVFAGGALAGNGNGNGNANGNESAPGQQKQEQAQPAEQPAAQQPAAQQPQQQADHAVKAVSTPADTSPGVKPSNSTTKWTHCKTGGTAANATCTAQPGTPNTKADVSKRYGNGKTAAQIAVSRGAPAETLITGPGNSQPHKVSDCRHKSNKSGGVDVHAVKSYSTSCGGSEGTAASTATCGGSMEHGKGHAKHESSCGSSCGTSACTSQHATVVTQSTVVTQQAATAAAPATPSTNTVTPSANVVQPVTVQALPAVQGAPSPSATPTNTGGVLGAQTTLGTPKSKPSALNAVGNVAAASLPFTGFPLWLAVLAGLALLLAGFTLRRRGSAASPA